MELVTREGVCLLSGKHYTIEHGPEEAKFGEEGNPYFESSIVNIWETRTGRRVDVSMFPAMGYEEKFVLTITEDGLATMVSAFNYPARGRGGGGVVNVINGVAAAIVTCQICDEVVVTGNQGTMLRTKVSGIRRTNRNSPGLRLISLRKGEVVVSASVVEGNYYIDDDTE